MYKYSKSKIKCHLHITPHNQFALGKFKKKSTYDTINNTAPKIKQTRQTKRKSRL